MEEAKAAAYYDELTRKGEGAARFKQGLGFSCSSSSDPLSSKPSSSSSSLFSNFVRASSPGAAEKGAQIQSIQDKLHKSRRRSPSLDRGRDSDGSDRHSRSERKEYERGRRRRRSRSASRDKGGGRGEDRRRRRRSRSGSRDRGRREDPHRRRRSRSDSRDRGKERRRRSASPCRNAGRERRSPRRERERNRNDDVMDYSQLIEGYSQMTPAERVKARMKLQLAETAAKDKGVTTGWERFDFDKDAPLDDDEIEVAEDDASLVKDIGHSFRYSAVEAKREADVKAAHDQAMFGVPTTLSPPREIESVQDKKTKQSEINEPSNALISDKVIAMQQGSWRDRARKLHNGSKN